MEKNEINIPSVVYCTVTAVDAMSTSAKLAAKVKADKEEQSKAVLKTTPTPEKQKVINLQNFCKTFF